MSWSLDDIDWSSFDPSKIAPDTLAMVKAAALVEYNGGAYATHLKTVFYGFPDLCVALDRWGAEEVQHGKALAEWVRRADPNFDFSAAFKRFTAGYVIPSVDAQSLRGSRCGELIARCIVETGTSSFYSVLAAGCEEPVLKDIARRIASDEFRHYKFFYQHIDLFAAEERMSRMRRVLIALGRIGETEDDELAYAYYAANCPTTEAYDRQHCIRRYMAPVYDRYKPTHMDRAIAMISKAVGLRLGPRLRSVFSWAAMKLVSWKSARFQKG